MMKKSIRYPYFAHLLGIGLLLLILSSCKKQSIDPPIDPVVQAEREDQAIRQYLQENNLTATRTDVGIYYIKLDSVPDGRAVQVGNTVRVHYIGQLLYGRVFDNSYVRGEPLQFQVGAGTVVSGFDYAVRLLKEGERATFFIPSRYAYGENGSGNTIPSYATLIFEIKLEDIL